MIFNLELYKSIIKQLNFKFGILSEFFIWLIQKSQFRCLHQLNEKFKQWMLHSNRIYVNLDQAHSINYGCVSDGPAGTRKTDTKKIHHWLDFAGV